MKRTGMLLASAALLLTSLLAPAGAQDRNAEIMTKLFSKISDSFSVGKPTAPDSEQNFLVLLNPGIALAPKLQPKTNIDDAYTLSQLLNVAPAPGWIYQESSNTVPQLWRSILQFKVTPDLQLTADQKKRLADARALIEDPNSDDLRTDVYRKYRKFRTKWTNAYDSYQDAVADAQISGRPVPRSAQAEVDDTMNDWRTLGRKAEVETALETIRELSGQDPKTLWLELSNRYDRLRKLNTDGAEYEVTYSFPDYAEWASDEGWTKVDFTETDITKQQDSSYVNAGASFKKGWGLWRASASGNFSYNSSYASSDVKDLKLRFYVKRVTIFRPWMEPFVLRLRSWRMGSGAGNVIVSDGGTMSRDKQPSGQMPLLVTGVLLAKDISVQGKWGTDELRKMDEQLSAKGSYGWGPFSVGGNAKQGKSTSYSRAEVTSTGFTTEGMQIIGYFCDVLPKCPNPDPSLNWPK